MRFVLWSIDAELHTLVTVLLSVVASQLDTSCCDSDVAFFTLGCARVCVCVCVCVCVVVVVLLCSIALRCQHMAKRRFLNMRQNVTEKLYLLDNKRRKCCGNDYCVCICIFVFMDSPQALAWEHV